MGPHMISHTLRPYPGWYISGTSSHRKSQVLHAAPCEELWCKYSIFSYGVLLIVYCFQFKFASHFFNEHDLSIKISVTLFVLNFVSYREIKHFNKTRFMDHAILTKAVIFFRQRKNIQIKSDVW